MAQPVITGINAPATALAGTPIDVTVTFTDPGATTTTLTATATNTATGEATTAATQISVTDPITVALVCDDPTAVVTDQGNGTFTILFP